VIIRIIIIIFY